MCMYIHVQLEQLFAKFHFFFSVTSEQSLTRTGCEMKLCMPNQSDDMRGFSTLMYSTTKSCRISGGVQRWSKGEHGSWPKVLLTNCVKFNKGAVSRSEPGFGAGLFVLALLRVETCND